ncbi:gephyrin-like molybdotransferase Glp [Celeribacter indicus]|uniref:Molybdopterin molybdenumtransferase n=1 Tax=Celeribacter indicus TaxID=1208324 RepID=A0A0B5DTB3_9RHOB|nr:gephyrin-like molybdotransferase Glp [Celeribacter indicus]AJE46304.1 molybdopterin biosynthesis protein MoeA [Celeribacter indicus]SDW52802.1 molybdopterin molybdotransferase [Celeribacter indicus]
MISVSDALENVLALCAPLPTETVPLRAAHGRVLARDALARRDQPPFAASAMDGYALRSADCAPGASFAVVGESAAGHGFDGTVGTGQTVRIFTGAPVPAGADRVVIQEDVTRAGDRITLSAPIGDNTNIRPAGGDFRAGDRLEAPRRLTPRDVVLLAAMNLPEVEVYRRPEVALIATGDELVMPGEEPGPSQIIASNTFGLAAMVEAAGGVARVLPIAPDDEPLLRQSFALAGGADLIVTIGGASVGDHDLVGKVAADLGLARAFYKVAMRPGKPLMAGRMGGSVMLGLPGNPVSSMVTAQVFMLPALAAMQGLPPAPPVPQSAPLLEDVAANGPRTHYMRAIREAGGIRPFASQDSSLVSILSRADALILRPPHDPARRRGEPVDYLAI